MSNIKSQTFFLKLEYFENLDTMLAFYARLFMVELYKIAYRQNSINFASFCYVLSRAFMTKFSILEDKYISWPFSG